MANDSIPEKADAVWSANQMLAWHLARQPLPWRNWSADMYRELPRAQLALSKELGDKKRIARGIRPGSQGASEPIPEKLFRLGFPVVVDPTGYLRTLHPRDQHKFEEFKIKYGIPEWSGIEFDSDETSTPAVDAPIAPAEPQPRTLIETGRVVWLRPPTPAAESEPVAGGAPAVSPTESHELGHPTAIEVVVAEGRQRIEAGEVTPSLGGLTKYAEPATSVAGPEAASVDAMTAAAESLPESTTLTADEDLTDPEPSLANKGGRPPIWDFVGVIPLLEARKADNKPFKDMAALKSYIQRKVQRVDGVNRGDGPDVTTVERAITKHGLDEYSPFQK